MSRKIYSYKVRQMNSQTDNPIVIYFLVSIVNILWYNYAFMCHRIWPIICSVNDLSHAWRQTITWINVYFLSNKQTRRVRVSSESDQLWPTLHMMSNTPVNVTGAIKLSYNRLISLMEIIILLSRVFILKQFLDISSGLPFMLLGIIDAFLLRNSYLFWWSTRIT